MAQVSCYLLTPWLLFGSQCREQADVHLVKLGTRFHYARFKVIKYLLLQDKVCHSCYLIKSSQNSGPSFMLSTQAYILSHAIYIIIYKLYVI